MYMTGVHHIAKTPESYEVQANSKLYTIRKRIFLKMALHKFIHVTFPHLQPILLTIILLDFIWTMQVFPLIWMTTGGGPLYSTEMLSTFTYKLAFSSYKFSLASASAFIVLLISLSVSIFYINKQFKRE